MFAKHHTQTALTRQPWINRAALGRQVWPLGGPHHVLIGNWPNAISQHFLTL